MKTLFSMMLLSVVLLSGCGSKNNPAPIAPPPTNPNVGGYYGGGYGGGCGGVGGTPLTQQPIALSFISPVSRQPVTGQMQLYGTQNYDASTNVSINLNYPDFPYVLGYNQISPNLCASTSTTTGQIPGISYIVQYNVRLIERATLYGNYQSPYTYTGGYNYGQQPNVQMFLQNAQVIGTQFRGCVYIQLSVLQPNGQLQAGQAIPYCSQQ